MGARARCASAVRVITLPVGPCVVRVIALRVRAGRMIVRTAVIQANRVTMIANGRSCRTVRVRQNLAGIVSADARHLHRDPYGRTFLQ